MSILVAVVTSVMLDRLAGFAEAFIKVISIAMDVLYNNVHVLTGLLKLINCTTKGTSKKNSAPLQACNQTFPEWGSISLVVTCYNSSSQVHAWVHRLMSLNVKCKNEVTHVHRCISS